MCRIHRKQAKTYALFDLSVGWPRQTYLELGQRPIQRGEHDVVSPVRFARTPHPSRTALRTKAAPLSALTHATEAPPSMPDTIAALRAQPAEPAATPRTAC